jgi:phosphatidate cytidylyltransferase
MKKRLLTALVGIPATILLVLYAPTSVFSLVLAGTTALCIEELLVLGAGRDGVRPGRWALILGGAVTVSFQWGALWVVGALTLGMLASATVTAFTVPLEKAFPKAALALMGILYIALPLGFLLWLRRELVIALLATIWIGDAAALYGGRLMGRHALAPRISPKKTIEGAFAGLIASVIAGVLLGVWLTDETPGRLLSAAFFAAVAGQVGDLAESALKRSSGVKDSSTLLPGHGGMLDRLDGLLFAAPVYYWFFMS